MFTIYRKKENTDLFFDHLKADITANLCGSLADVASHVKKVKPAIETLP